MQPICPQILQFIEDAEKKEKSVFSSSSFHLKVMNVTCSERKVRNQRYVSIAYNTLFGLTYLKETIDADKPHQFHRCSKNKIVIGNTEFTRRHTFFYRLAEFTLKKYEKS